MAKSQKKTKNSFQNCDQMKWVFWNSRGLGDLAKHRFLSDLVKEEQISFIALSETGRDEFPDCILKNLCAGRDFLWHSMAPHGRSGGILLGVDLQVFDIGAIAEGDFYVKFTLRCKMTVSNLCYIRSTAQHNIKTSRRFWPNWQTHAQRSLFRI